MKDPLTEVLELDSQHTRTDGRCEADGQRWPCDAHELLERAAEHVENYQASQQ